MGENGAFHSITTGPNPSAPSVLHLHNQNPHLKEEIWLAMRYNSSIHDFCFVSFFLNQSRAFVIFTTPEDRSNLSNLATIANPNKRLQKQAGKEAGVRLVGTVNTCCFHPTLSPSHPTGPFAVLSAQPLPTAAPYSRLVPWSLA